MSHASGRTYHINSIYFIIAIICLFPVQFAVSCGDIITTDTTLTSDLTCDGTALYIGANNIVLDCNGYKITHTGFASYGVYAGWVSGITIKNCNIVGQKLTNNNGIRFYYASNSRIQNVNVSNHERGIYLLYSNYNNISDTNASFNKFQGIGLDSNSQYNSLFNVSAFYNDQYGIRASSASNNNISNSTASFNGDANFILSPHSNYNILSNVTATFSPWYGIIIEGGIGNNLSGSSMSNNTINLAVSQNEEAQYIDTSNLVDGKPVYWLKNVENQVYDSSTNAGMFFCYQCNNITVKDLILTNNSFGIMFKQTENSTISNITAAYQDRAGIILQSSQFNNISNVSTYSNWGSGVYLYSNSNFNLLSNITSYNNVFGAYIYDSSNNTLSGSNILNNTNYGINIQGSDNIAYNTR
ncbi:MAG: right-handed parallel beta-helix repeat-containing protein, partial [Candidatus Micrarchaeota archaeon]|nr:right-handed parallel beta-helix repeat-containing protein [Candidatus Micrarchaeota archaeon]